MYIVNPEKMNMEKLYKCSTAVRNWLIYEKHLPLFGQNSKSNEWYFVRTEALEKALTEMPLLLSIVEILS